MRTLERIIINKNAALITILLGFLVSIVFTIIGNFIIPKGGFSPQILSNYGGFIGGVLGPILSLSGFIIIYLSFTRQNEQHFESNLMKQIDNFRSVDAYLLKTDAFVSYNEFFKELYLELLKGTDSPIGKFETDDTNDGTEIFNKFSNYKAYFFDYISRINIIIDNIKSNSFSNKTKYYQLLFSRLSIFELFFLKTLTIRMNDNKDIKLKENNINEAELRNKLYNYLVKNELLPIALKKTDKNYYKIYLETLEFFKIEIP